MHSLEPYHDADDEPTAPPLPPDFFFFDNVQEQLSRDQLKQLIYSEIMTDKTAASNGVRSQAADANVVAAAGEPQSVAPQPAPQATAGAQVA